MTINRTRTNTPLKKVSQKTINKVTREIVASCNPELVILFGSYGRGTPKEDSDLDIFIVANVPGSSSEKIRFVNRAITTSGFGIDVVIRNREQVQKALSGRDWFIQEIMREGKVMYER